MLNYSLQLRRLADYPPPSHTLPTPLIVLCCIPVFIIILLTVFGNLLVLFFKARVGRTNTTLLVWNLGLTDFLVGVIVLPLGAFHLAYRKWIFGRFLCRVWVAADVTFCTCSVSQNTLRVHFGKNNGMVEHQRRVLRTHERIAKTLGVVSCSFLFCWLPFFSLYLTNL
ncbi:hypothetical protein OESDEN_01074 [Oesophagostomum dentatum]|uniref:G-protein coupled receptors family 1 profile domain-containing protein n=1 Tax=Oesophagostomum dentatum TaxID=61180 RepID=A0A0B1TU30_OESDE|nr:hypothetical protein OESDEN_01074 [Oesophagostomum dentatum]